MTIDPEARRPTTEAGAGKLSDAELLRAYANARSQPAFTEFVRRHLGLVYFAALRRTGGNSALAEEISQSVFTEAARRAAVLAHHGSLAGWLYTTTRNAAVMAVRKEHARQRREQEATRMHQLDSTEPARDWETLRPLIDSALDALSERDREAVLLRFFEGQRFPEVGAALQISEDAARMRVERALEKLQALLAKQGVTSTAGALAAMLAAQAAATAPAGLAAVVTATALHGAVAAAGAGSLAAAFYFMSGSKIALSLASAGTIVILAAVYEWREGRGAARELAAARAEGVNLAARLATLEREWQQAERDRAARPDQTDPVAALAPVQTAAAAAAVEPSRAAQDKALQLLLANDPELRRMRLEQQRLVFMSTHAPVLTSFGLSAEQVSRAADIFVQNRELENADRGAGLQPQHPDAAFAKIRAELGDDVADKLARHIEGSWAVRIVQGLASEQYFTNEPITREQGQRLAAVIRSSSSGKPPGNATNYASLAFVDWKRVLDEAQAFLSPAQMRALGNLAARGSNAALEKKLTTTK